MNRTYHRVTALLLALVLTLSPAASASWALGHELYDEVTTLAPGVTYTTGRLWSDSKSDLRTERYVSYTPGSTVTPIVAYGASLTQRQTLTDFARALEAAGNRVLAGINGDYFVMSTGQPLGLTLTDGIIRSAYSLSSTSASHYAVGWLPDGTAFVGDPGLTIQATIGGFTLDVNGINKVREATGGYFVFNSDFGSNTMNSSSGVDVILTPVTEENAQQVIDELTIRQQAILDEEYAKALAEAEAAQAAQEAEGEQTDPPAPEEPTDPTGTVSEETPTGDADADSSTDTSQEPPTVVDPCPEETEGPGTGIETDLETETTTDPETDPTTDPETETTTDPETETTTDPEPETPTDPETETTTDPETDPTTDPETDPIVFPERQIFTPTATGPWGTTVDLTVGSSITYIVEEVIETGGATTIPEGKIVLSINKQSNAWLVERLLALKPGDRVDLSISSEDSRWTEVDSAIGSMHRLLSGGQIGTDLDADAAPRTAIGVRADGSTVLYTIDGRQSGYSVGATMEMVAQRLQELGCVEAVSMDGGGSTTIGTTSALDELFSHTNQPSDGSQRPVTNAIFLVSSLPATGQLDSLSIQPTGQLMLSGATIPLTTYGVDTGYHPMGQVTGATFTAQGGTITADGLFTAGLEAGVAQVTATLGEAVGTATYTVVSTPTSLTVRDQTTGDQVSSLALDPGDAVDLTAAATYYTLPLTADDTCFLWEVSNDLGAFDSQGVFTAGSRGGSGEIFVTAGDMTVSIPFTISSHVDLLEDFEERLTAVVGGDLALVEGETAADYVKLGRQSLRVTYNATQAPATLSTAFPLPAENDFLSLYVWGDGSGSALSAFVSDAEGTGVSIPLATLDFTGWQRLTAELPEGAVWLTDLTLSGGAGVIRLDHLTTSNSADADAVPPTIQLSLTDGVITASAADDLDALIPWNHVTITCDGAPIPYVWDAAYGSLTAPYPAVDGGAHRITVTVSDASGNLARASLDVPAVEPSTVPFADTTGHWAEFYTTYLWDRGISNGLVENDVTLFNPDKEITRGEFCLMVARWLGLDTTAYADVTLPFADLDQIPAWCLDGVKALYAEGIFNGSAEDGLLLANAQSSIKRSEAMTLLGRVQAKGYPGVQANFTDAADIPAWALDYINSLVGQGVVSGYEGALRPNAPVTRAEIAKMLYALR